MNFSQFSKNKLEEEQMVAVKGGLQRIHKVCWKIQEDGRCYISEGWSVERADGSWGWEEECGYYERTF